MEPNYRSYNTSRQWIPNSILTIRWMNKFLSRRPIILLSTLNAYMINSDFHELYSLFVGQFQMLLWILSTLFRPIPLFKMYPSSFAWAQHHKSIWFTPNLSVYSPKPSPIQLSIYNNIFRWLRRSFEVLRLVVDKCSVAKIRD